MCILHNVLEVQIYLNEYNKVKSSTVTTGYDMDVTDIIKIHIFMNKSFWGQSNQWVERI